MSANPSQNNLTQMRPSCHVTSTHCQKCYVDIRATFKRLLSTAETPANKASKTNTVTAVQLFIGMGSDSGELWSAHSTTIIASKLSHNSTVTLSHVAFGRFLVIKCCPNQLPRRHRRRHLRRRCRRHRAPPTLLMLGSA